MSEINIEQNDVILKYPRTYHLPYSPGTTNDDKKLPTDFHLENKEVVITLKLDGENCSMTNDRIWARSVDSKDHPSRNWIQQFWNVLKNDIPSGFRICGENLYAMHSIKYEELSSYFYVFNIWEGKRCLSWDDTKEWSEILGLNIVPELYRGVYDRSKIVSCATGPSLLGGVREGIVGRLPCSFLHSEFAQNTFKWVRKGHVKPNDGHWMTKAVIPNVVIY